MDQLVKEESQKLLTKQMEQARLQRRIQVRQQALAWTEATRKKFELAKEREIKKLANQVTEQAQQTVIERIQHLTELHDLAMTEIGMAHRAAAGAKEIEKLKFLKRLKNEEVAKNRGTSALMKLSKEKQLANAKTSAVLNRKKEVRRIEDLKSQEIISRRPFALKNFNGDARSSKTHLGPPEYQQSLAETLSTAKPATTSDRKSSKTSVSQSQASRKSSDKVPIRSARSSDEMLRSTAEVKSDQGVLAKMVRIRTSEQTKVRRSLTTTRSMDPLTPPEMQASSNAVRYYDTAVPKREVKYIQPAGLSVKESRSSPDAWEKGKLLSEQLLKEQEERTQRQEELEQKQKERSVQAILEERLNKQKMILENQLKDIIDPKHQPLDIGSQRGIFELGAGVKFGIRNRTSSSENLESRSSDKLHIDEADQGFLFSQSLSSDSVHGPIASSNFKTLEKFRLEPKLKVLSERGILKKRMKKQKMDLENQLKDPEHQLLGVGTSRGVLEPEAGGKSRTQNLTSSAEYLETSDEFSAVESDEEYVFPEIIPSVSGHGSVPSSGTIRKNDFANKQRGRNKQVTLEERGKKQKVNLENQGRDSKHKLVNITTSLGSSDIGTSQGSSDIGTSQGSSDIGTSQGNSELEAGKEHGIQTSSKSNVDYSTEYYSPPAEGPFHSTPDGELLHHKRKKKTKEMDPEVWMKKRMLSQVVEKFLKRRPESIEKMNGDNSVSSSRLLLESDLLASTSSGTPSRSEGSEEYYTKFTALSGSSGSSSGSKRSGSSRTGEGALDETKRRALTNLLNKFLAMQPESIEDLPVTVSSGSIIEADSELASRSGSTTKTSAGSESCNSGYRRSRSSVDIHKDIPTLLDNGNKDGSGSTLTTVTHIVPLDHSNSSSDKSGTLSSKNYSSGSPSGFDETGSTLTAVTRMVPFGQSGSSSGSSFQRHNGNSDPLLTSGERTSLSNDTDSSIPDAGKVLEQIVERGRRPLSRISSESSSKSGPERETDRVELLEEVTPVRLWQTPSRENQIVKDETDELSVIFDNLIDKWMNVKISPPPWFKSVASMN